jgi:uncharacterized protein (UPF0297 family)
MGEMDETRRLAGRGQAANEADAILQAVYQALKDRGYNPISQLAGYLLSGDPAFITSHQEARSLIRRVERDELVEELLRQFVQRLEGQPLS